MRPSLVFVASLLLAPAASAQDPRHRPAEITVSAVGETRATPDRAIVTLGVESRASTAAAAARANAATQRAVLDTLRALGFRDDQLMTMNFNVRPDYDGGSRRDGPPRVSGYVVSNTVMVTLDNLSRSGQVIDAALAKGANMVYGMALTLADPAPARRQALANAVTQARAEAETLARAAGVSLGRLVELTTGQGSAPRMMNRGIAGGMVVAAASISTPIETGEATVTATVTARWEVAP